MGASSYELYYSTVNTPPVPDSTATIDNIIGLTREVTGLTANTPHYFWVRARAGDGVAGEWSGLPGGGGITPVSGNGKVEIQFQKPTDVSDDISFSDSPGLSLDWSDNTELTVKLSGTYNSYQWYLDGSPIPNEGSAGPVTDPFLVLHARNYSGADHNLVIRVNKDGHSYSKSVIFSVEP
jgi:hypothetical protein